jgi:hypothetical protein
MKISVHDFATHTTGRRFTDVLGDPRLPFSTALAFFDLDRVRSRMKDSEMHHDSPALAGVVKEFERIPEIDQFFRTTDAHETTRFRQAVGVLVLMSMEQEGWQKTGRKGALGRRAKVHPGTTTPGAYINRTGISRWFTQTERYAPRAGWPAGWQASLAGAR